jgi:hypothetical protein
MQDSGSGSQAGGVIHSHCRKCGYSVVSTLPPERVNFCGQCGAKLVPLSERVTRSARSDDAFDDDTPSSDDTPDGGVMDEEGWSDSDH